MLPNKLVLQAFGPFAAREEIDFSKLHSTSLFLINGPTGAGKSTILDAICFALYGQTTGNERDGAQMRSDYAKENLETVVEYQFCLADKRYKVRRAPAQTRAKTRGEGYRQIPSDAQLWVEAEPEQWLLQGKSVQEVNEAVVTLLGLSAAQFRQVIVLPQGKFREFLLADSRARESILAALFKTDIYSKIENILKEQASAIRQNSADFDVQKNTLLEVAAVLNEEELSVRLEALRNALEKNKASRSVADEALAKSLKRYEDACRLMEKFTALQASQSLIEQLGTKRSEIDLDKANLAKLQQANELRALVSEAQNLDEQQHNNKKQQARLAKLSEEKAKDLRLLIQKNLLVQEQYKSIDELRAALERNKQLLNDYTTQQTILNEIEQSEKQRALIKKQLDLCTKKRAELKSTLSLLEQRIQQEPQLLDAREQAREDCRNAELQLQNTQNMAGLQAVLREEQAHLVKADGELKEAQELMENASRVLTETQLQWHLQQAAILAQQLQVGKPCPVCGSLEHPNPCVTQGILVSAEHLEQLKQELEKRQAEKEKSWQAHNKRFQQVESIKSSIAQQTVLVADWHSGLVEEATAVLHAKTEILESLSQSVNKLQAEKHRHLELVQQDKSLVEQEKAELINQSKIDQKLADLYTQAQRLGNQLKEGAVAQTFVSEIDETERKISQLQQQRDETQQNVSACEKQKAEHDASLKLLVQQFEERLSLIDDLKSELNKKIQASPFSDKDDLLRALEQASELPVIQARIEEFEKTWIKQSALLENLKQELTGKSMPNLSDFEQELEAQRLEQNKIEEAFIQSQSDFNQVQNFSKRLAQLNKRFAKLNDQYKVIGTMADVANGHNDSRISLQRFVLSVLLDDVLQQGNLRLQKMSLGRYSMQRKEERSKGNRASGLEVEIFDQYSGRSRSAATLSGGESFIAALALALGLADVVQAQSGGVRLDALFIDEGFGSLDSEALELAMRVLLDMQERGKMTGIISHVQELKEQIPVILDVLPSREGSRVVLRS